MNIGINVKTDCKYYKGDRPCIFHKQKGAKCHKCLYYKKLNEKILIIKLGGLGDVIRTTPLLRKLKEVFPNSEISWLTHFPEILSKSFVDNALAVNLDNIAWLEVKGFDWLINLDKEKLAISLSKTVHAKKKSGFTIGEFGKCRPVSTRAEMNKWLTGIDDGYSKRNQRHYLEEIFNICGFDFQGEEYIIEDGLKDLKKWKGIDCNKKVVGLNTGCGGYWGARLWPRQYWVELARRLIDSKVEVIILGGEKEHDGNVEISGLSGAKYLGYFNLKEFIDIVNQCSLIITGVTMCLHLAIALKKRVILLNSTFNKNEFYLYNRGEVLEPEIECNCYYLEECPKDCMQYLSVDKVYRHAQSGLK